MEILLGLSLLTNILLIWYIVRLTATVSGLKEDIKKAHKILDQYVPKPKKKEEPKPKEKKFKIKYYD